MKAPNITEGDWIIHDSYTEFGCNGIRTKDYQWIAHCPRRAVIDEEKDANAKLIAAAPAMARELHRAYAVFKQKAGEEPSPTIGGWNWKLLEQRAKQAMLSAGYIEEEKL